MSYHEYGLSLTDIQKSKIANSITKKKSTTIRLTPYQYQGNDKLMLTKQQIAKIVKHKQLGTGVDITLSVAQLKKQKGGWIAPLLIGLAGSILPSLFGKGLTLPGTSGRGLFLGR